MNSIWCIAVAVFTIAAFLQWAELGLERHETNDVGVCVDPFVMRGVLLEVSERIRSCYGPNQFV